MKNLIFIVGCIAFLVANAVTAADLEAGVRAAKRGDYATAFEEWKPLAEQGDPVAQYNIGWLYREGKGVSRDDRQAFNWFGKAASQGQANAQLRVGWMYANGVGVKTDLRKAAIWSAAAARQGKNEAKANLAAICHELGWAYMGGNGGYPQDLSFAYMWFALSAQNGNRDAVGMRDTMARTLDRMFSNAERREVDARLKKCISSGYQQCG